MDFNWKHVFRGTFLVFISMFFTILLFSFVHFFFEKEIAHILNYIISIFIISKLLMIIFADDNKSKKEEDK